MDHQESMFFEKKLFTPPQVPSVPLRSKITKKRNQCDFSELHIYRILKLEHCGFVISLSLKVQRHSLTGSQKMPGLIFDIISV